MRFLTMIGLGVALVAGAFGLAAQRREAASLRAELAGRQRLAAEARRLADDHWRLESEQVAPAEVARRRDERALLTAMAAEVEGIRQRAQIESAPAISVPAAEARPWLRREEVPAEAWAHRGAANPDSAFETVLWAAAHGDLDTLAGLLAFDDDARSSAQALFDRLPSTLRTEMGTPAKLVALLTAKAVPLTSARILTQVHDDTQAQLTAQLRDEKGVARATQLTLRAAGDRWRLMVPATAIDKFADQLRPASVALTPVTVPPGP